MMMSKYKKTMNISEIGFMVLLFHFANIKNFSIIFHFTIITTAIHFTNIGFFKEMVQFVMHEIFKLIVYLIFRCLQTPALNFLMQDIPSPQLNSQVI